MLLLLLEFLKLKLQTYKYSLKWKVLKLEGRCRRVDARKEPTIYSSTNTLKGEKTSWVHAWLEVLSYGVVDHIKLFSNRQHDRGEYRASMSCSLETSHFLSDLLTTMKPWAVSIDTSLWLIQLFQLQKLKPSWLHAQLKFLSHGVDHVKLSSNRQHKPEEYWALMSCSEETSNFSSDLLTMKMPWEYWWRLEMDTGE